MTWLKISIFILNYLGGPNVNISILKFAREGQGRRLEWYDVRIQTADTSFGDVGRGSQVKEFGQPLEADEGKETNFPLECWERASWF